MKNVIKQRVLGLALDTRAAASVDFLIWVLISVVVGALVLGLLKVAVPNLFQSLLDKVSSMMS